MQVLCSLKLCRVFPPRSIAGTVLDAESRRVGPCPSGPNARERSAEFAD